MFPNFFIFGREIGFYPLMVLCGIFSAGIYGCIKAEKRKDDYIDFIFFALFIFIGVIAGGHLLYAIVNYKEIIYVFQNIEKIKTFEMFLYAMSRIFGGSVFYGGLIGGLIAGSIALKKNKNFSNYVDVAATVAPLFHFFGRIGCFLGSCCFGVASKIGFVYRHSPIEEANGIIRFPVQLLEALFNLVLFFILRYFLNKEKFKNKLVYIYLLMYAAGRFFIEFFRGDAYRGIWWILSTSQIISILIILTVTVRLFIIKKASVKVEN